MNRVVKAAALAIAFCLCIGLSACGSSVSETGVSDKEISQSGTSEVQNQAISESEDNDIADSTTESIQYTEETSKTGGQVTDAEPEASGTDVLVVVFSATGTTKGVAEKIVAIESADLYEIIPSEPYSDADLDWNDSNSRTTKEQNDSSVRPGIASETIDLSGYSKIYIGESDIIRTS